MNTIANNIKQTSFLFVNPAKDALDICSKTGRRIGNEKEVKLVDGLEKVKSQFPPAPTLKREFPSIAFLLLPL